MTTRPTATPESNPSLKGRTMKRTLTTTTAAALALGITLAPSANATEETPFAEYETTVCWSMDNTDGIEGTYEWPQTRSTCTPVPACEQFIELQVDQYWIRDAEDEAYLAGLNVLSSPADDARLEPHGYYSKLFTGAECVVEEPEVPVDPEPPVDPPVDPPVVVDPPVDEPVDPPITDTPPPVDEPVVDEPTTPTVEQPETPEKVDTIVPVVKAETPTTTAEATPALPNAGGPSPRLLIAGLLSILAGSLAFMVRRIRGQA